MRLAGLLAAAVVASAPPADVASLQGWKSLTLKAQESPLYAGSATLEISEGRHEATGRAAIVLRTQSEARLLGAIGFEEKTTSWIDAETRRPLELFQLRPGEGARRYRFEPAGVRQTTWEAPEGGSGVPFEQWPSEEGAPRRATFADGSAVPESAPLVDLYSLLYLVRDMDLRGSGTPREFVALHRRHAVRLVVTPSERRVQERSAVDEASGSARTLRLNERRLDVRSAAGNGPKGLLGMEGDLRIWIDEASGAVVEVRGTARGLGPTSLALSSFKR